MAGEGLSHPACSLSPEGCQEKGCFVLLVVCLLVPQRGVPGEGLFCPACSLSPVYPERGARGRLLCPPCSLSLGFPERGGRGRLVSSCL